MEAEKGRDGRDQSDLRDMREIWRCVSRVIYLIANTNRQTLQTWWPARHRATTRGKTTTCTNPPLPAQHRGMSVWGPGTRQVWGSTSTSLGLIMQDVWPSWLACNVVACGLPVPRTACLCPAQCWGLEVAGTLSSLQSAACSSLPAQGSLPHSATVISTQIIHRKLGTWSRLTAPHSDHTHRASPEIIHQVSCKNPTSCN